MNTTRIYQVDAFTDKLFGGNPAAVCILEKWPADGLLQNIAAENNLAETAFVVQENGHYKIRWFTPTVEVDLCGHATLASAHVLFNHLDYAKDEIIFMSPRSGQLTVKKHDDTLSLDFPVDVFQKTGILAEIVQGLKATPPEVYKGKTDYMAVFNSQHEIECIVPDLAAISKLNARGLIVTAPGDECDFVSRFFAPQSGINEDPVTGSAHTTLTPYWSERLGRKNLTAIQVSPRRGYLNCINNGSRIIISGKARTYLTGQIETA